MAGNLGRYQEIATEAKEAGGVDSWISNIEAAAASKAFPKAFAQGVGACAVVVSGVAFTAVAVKRYVDERRTREALANEAKEQLKTELNKPGGEKGTSSPEGK